MCEEAFAVGEAEHDVGLPMGVGGLEVPSDGAQARGRLSRCS